MGWNLAVMSTSNANPAAPPGSLVLMRPMAVRSMTLLMHSCSSPLYMSGWICSPPPPRMAAVSSTKPMPSGSLKPIVRFSGPNPAPGEGNARRALTPIRSTLAAIGPSVSPADVATINSIPVVFGKVLVWIRR